MYLTPAGLILEITCCVLAAGSRKRAPRGGAQCYTILLLFVIFGQLFRLAL